MAHPSNSFTLVLQRHGLFIRHDTDRCFHAMGQRGAAEQWLVVVSSVAVQRPIR
jgi:hypothetical protein